MTDAMKEGMPERLLVREAKDRRDTRVGVLLRTEVADARHDFQSRVGKALDDSGAERRTDVGRRLTRYDDDVRGDRGQLLEDAVVRAHREDLRLDLGPALQLEDAVAAVAQAVVDVRVQRFVGHD